MYVELRCVFKEKYDLYIGDKGVTLGNFLAWDTESNKFYLYEGVV